MLLISWEDCDSHTSAEVDDLQETFGLYHFITVQFAIPLNNPYLTLLDKLANFMNDYDDGDSLLIIYYNGVGFSKNFDTMLWARLVTLYVLQLCHC